jgi:alpha-tubulin suppressor-like RCC1 family protein
MVACADTSTIALTAAGRVLAWGHNPDGRLGHACDSGVIGEVSGIENAVAIAAGQSHFLAVCKKVSGESVVVVWGNNFHCAIGLDSSVSYAVSPVELSFFKNAAFVAAGWANSACIDNEGQLYVWGDNKFSKCGVRGELAAAAVIPVPTLLTGFTDARIVYCALGSLYSAAIDSSGRLFTWGYGKAGNLGHGNRSNVAFPQEVVAFRGISISHVACTVGQISPVTEGSVEGKENPHTLAVAADGRLFSFGTCHKGILGNHSQKILSPKAGDELSPYCVGRSPARDSKSAAPTGYLANETCVFAVSSSIHSCVGTASGDLFSFGCGSGGRMGIERYMNGLSGARSRMKCYVSVPTAIEYFQKRSIKVLHVSSSRRHMAAVCSTSE